MKLYKTPFPAGMKYQFATIQPGQRGRIYLFTNWGGNFRAFIDRVGMGPDVLPWNLVHFIWLIDGTPVEDFQYQVDRINSPRHYDPPIIAKKSIEWIGINNDAVPHIMQVLCDGELVEKPARRVPVG